MANNSSLVELSGSSSSAQAVDPEVVQFFTQENRDRYNKVIKSKRTFKNQEEFFFKSLISKSKWGFQKTRGFSISQPLILGHEFKALDAESPPPSLQKPLVRGSPPMNGRESELSRLSRGRRR
ncbi:hypothetical protein V6N13_072512 [Hibiscus sabdariffa]